MKIKYTLKFVWGVILMILSFIIGGVSKILFILYINNKTIAVSMAILYIISWPMLILGVWWVGKEYAESIKRYFKYKYYTEHVTAGAKKVVDKTKVVKARAKEKGDQIKNNVRVRINNERERRRNKRKAVIIKNS